MRNDIHTPSQIRPGNYNFVIEYGRDFVSYDPVFGTDEEWSNMDEAEEAYKDAGAYIHGTRDSVDEAILRCDCCGARFKYGCLYVHRESGEVISLGHTCAAGMDLPAGPGYVRSRMAAERKVVLERRQRFSNLRKFAQEAGAQVLQDLRVDHYITKDIRAKLIRTGAKWGLSEKQVDLLRKLAVDASKPAEKHVPVPVDGERIPVTGTCVSFKCVDSMYGFQYKMTVKVETPEGSWLVYGTCPESIVDAAQDAGLSNPKGRVVTFTSKVSRGDRDPHFGFFSRPTKAELV